MQARVAIIAAAAAGLLAFAVPAHAARVPPLVLRSGSVNGVAVTLRFSRALRGRERHYPFDVSVNGAPRAVIAETPFRATLHLTLQRAVGADDDVTISRGGQGFAPPLRVSTGFKFANASQPGCSTTFEQPPNSYVGEGLNQPLEDIQSVGTIRLAMVFVDFPNAPASTAPHSLDADLIPFAEHWYSEVSYGRLSLSITPVERWVRMPFPSTSYKLDVGSSELSPDTWTYMGAALRAVHAAGVDLGTYDGVLVVASPGARFDRSFELSYIIGLAPDSVPTRFAAALNNDVDGRDLWARATTVHEIGHMLGLPDLYSDAAGAAANDYWSTLAAVGGWDVMSSSGRPGAGFLAWHRWKLGWLDATQLRCVHPGGSVEDTLTPLETSGGMKAIVVPLSVTKALVVENREKIGVDSGLCDAGVLVYTVDAAVESGSFPVRVQSAHAGGAVNESLRWRCAPIYDAPFDFGAGERSSWEGDGVKVELLAKHDANYDVRVSYAGP